MAATATSTGVAVARARRASSVAAVAQRRERAASRSRAVAAAGAPAPPASAERGGERAHSGRVERGLERRARGLAVDGEDDALEPRAGVEVAADLLDLDPRRLLQREAADAGAERDEREAARAERVGPRERGRGGAADDVGRGRAAELHRRGVDDPAARASPRPSSRPPRRGRSARPRATPRRPPGRRRGRSRRPRRRRAAARVLAALAIASTSSAVMSVSSTSTVAIALRYRGMTVRKRVRAHGRVQGVFFRDSVRREAEPRGVAGWARNRADGTVEAVFEGEPEAVDAAGRVRAAAGPGTREVAGSTCRGGAAGGRCAGSSVALSAFRQAPRAYRATPPPWKPPPHSASPASPSSARRASPTASSSTTACAVELVRERAEAGDDPAERGRRRDRDRRPRAGRASRPRSTPSSCGRSSRRSRARSRRAFTDEGAGGRRVLRQAGRRGLRARERPRSRKELERLFGAESARRRPAPAARGDGRAVRAHARGPAQAVLLRRRVTTRWPTSRPARGARCGAPPSSRTRNLRGDERADRRAASSRSQKLQAEREKALEVAAEHARSTAKGRPYEEAVFEARRRDRRARRATTATRSATCRGAGGRKGDVRGRHRRLRRRRRAARIVFEAKNSAGRARTALAELDEAMAQRDADYGVWVVPVRGPAARPRRRSCARSTATSCSSSTTPRTARGSRSRSPTRSPAPAC